VTAWAIARNGKLVRGTAGATRREAWIAFNEYENRWQLQWDVMLKLMRARGYRAVRVTVTISKGRP